MIVNGVDECIEALQSEIEKLKSKADIVIAPFKEYEKYPDPRIISGQNGILEVPLPVLLI